MGIREKQRKSDSQQIKQIKQIEANQKQRFVQQIKADKSKAIRQLPDTTETQRTQGKAKANRRISNVECRM